MTTPPDPYVCTYTVPEALAVLAAETFTAEDLSAAELELSDMFAVTGRITGSDLEQIRWVLLP